MLSKSNGRIVDPAATFCATPCEDSDGDEASTETNVKDKAEKSEEGDATEEASEDGGESRVDDRCSRHTLDRLLPCWNMAVVVGEVYGASVYAIEDLIYCADIHARYHEKMPSTRAEIANSRARSKLDAARVPKASFDMLGGVGSSVKGRFGLDGMDEREMQTGS